MQDENKEKGISLGQLLGVMFGRKILLAIITAVIFIVGTITFKFAYNDGEKFYTARFDYTIQGVTEGKYIDESIFDYRTLISYSNLQAIKESDSQFDGVNIDDMYEDNNISIEYVIEYRTVNDVETEEIKAQYYTISAGSSYFDNEKQARNFLDAIASQPLTRTLELVQRMDYSTYLTLFDKVDVYETQIEYLQSQLLLLQTKYTTLIDYYGDVTLKNEAYAGQKLSDVLALINVTFENLSNDSLIQEVEQNGYINKGSSNYVSLLTVQRQALENEKTINDAKLEALTQQRDWLIAKAVEGASGLQTVDLTTYNDSIIELTLRNADIVYEVDVINKKLESTATEEQLVAFEKTLKAFKDNLTIATTAYCENEEEVVETYANIYYHNNSIIIEDGGQNMLLMAAVFLVLGGIVGCCTNLVLDYKKLSYNDSDKEQA